MEDTKIPFWNKLNFRNNAPTTHPLISDSRFSLARCVTLSLDFTQMIASVADRTQVVAAVLLYLRRWFFVLTYAHPLFVRQIAGRHCSCTVGPNSKMPPKIKFMKLTDNTHAYNSLTNFEYEAYTIYRKRKCTLTCWTLNFVLKNREITSIEYFFGGF